MATTHVFQDALGYTFVVRVRPDGKAVWRKKCYKTLVHARRAIIKWAEDPVEPKGSNKVTLITPRMR